MSTVTVLHEGVFEKVQLELNQFGLLIYNANVKLLVDVPGHEYFSYLGKKTQMEAANQAKVDVAEAEKKGEVGAKLREGETLQNAAKIDAETKIIGTQRHGEGQKEEIKVKTEVKVFENLREAEVAEANADCKAGQEEGCVVEGHTGGRGGGRQGGGTEGGGATGSGREDECHGEDGEA